MFITSYKVHNLIWFFKKCFLWIFRKKFITQGGKNDN